MLTSLLDDRKYFSAITVADIIASGIEKQRKCATGSCCSFMSATLQLAKGEVCFDIAGLSGANGAVG
jgi:hypothetical protein